ncbi:hypothetical protein AVEN_78900-1, partial [Araneus ventricosus]
NFGVGQNLAIQYASCSNCKEDDIIKPKWADAIKGLYDEVLDFHKSWLDNFQSGRAETYVEHFTQVGHSWRLQTKLLVTAIPSYSSPALKWDSRSTFCTLPPPRSTICGFCFYERAPLSFSRVVLQFYDPTHQMENEVGFPNFSTDCTGSHRIFELMRSFPNGLGHSLPESPA